MGGKTTKLFKNSTQPCSKGQDENDTRFHEQIKNHNDRQPEKININHSLSPFVHYRKG